MVKIWLAFLIVLQVVWILDLYACIRRLEGRIRLLDKLNDTFVRNGKGEIIDGESDHHVE